MKATLRHAIDSKVRWPWQRIRLQQDHGQFPQMRSSRL